MGFFTYCGRLNNQLMHSNEARVANLKVRSNERGVWIPNFSKPLNDRDIEIVQCFLTRLQDKVVVVEGEDKVSWVKTKSGSFFVKPLHSILEARSVESIPTSVVWNVWIPPKVSFFA